MKKIACSLSRIIAAALEALPGFFLLPENSDRNTWKSL
jgi:hypothetical protein